MCETAINGAGMSMFIIINIIIITSFLSDTFLYVLPKYAGFKTRGTIYYYLYFSSVVPRIHFKCIL
jgi:hypothetical protein